jgi:Protein of unknown function (DUF3619)
MAKIMNATLRNLSLENDSIGRELTSEELLEDQIGKTVARSLDRELNFLSPKVLQRLEKSREAAIVQRKVGTSSRSLSLSRLFPNLGPLTPIFVVLLLVFAIAQWQQNARINDIADLDTAILTDTVPPDAYVDNGFRLFMKKMMNAPQPEATENVSSAENTNAMPGDSSQSQSELSKTPDISTNQ